MASFADVTIAVVSYNSAAVIEKCLGPLADIPNLVVVDNASRDDSVAVIKRLRPDAKIIRNADNIGWGPAVNQAFAAVETEFALLMNPDATISIDVAAQLRAAATANDNAAIVAPFLYSPRRGLELTMMGPGERNHQSIDVIPEGPVCTWFATGAVWFCRLRAFDQIGGFDEKIWVYCEDLDICHRMARGGFSVILLPDAKGEHLISRAAPPTLRVRWRKEWNIIWGHLYLIEKYESRDEMRAEAWRIFWKHAPKALFYLLVVRPKRLLRDSAAAHAALSYLLGRPARRKDEVCR